MTSSGNSQPERRASGPVTFISTMANDPWGGSEELWYEAAMNLAKSGVEVRACVTGWSPPHAKVQALRAAGVDLMFRTRIPSIAKRAAHRLLGRRRGNPVIPDVEKWLRRKPPALIIISEQFAMPPPDYTEMILANGWRYSAVAHANSEHWWPYPHEIEQYRRGVENAEVMYFVSNGNLKLAKKQAGFSGRNVEIIRNPYGVSRAMAAPWPAQSPAERLEIACVGRLDMRTKGQDVIIEALAADAWRDRNWQVNIYGDGHGKGVIQRLIRDAGLEGRITLKGHAKVEDIWKVNHILAQPSRAEGLPITIVEAMMSGRPVLTTDVAGNAELLEDGVSGFIADAPTVKNLSAALERMWERRASLETMGHAARIAVLKEIPADPGAVFADKIRKMIGLA
jgi:glycosyltransferase involved in cell wall biosynthesis